MSAPERVDDAVLEDLRRRLRATRRVRVPEVAAWSRGTDTEALDELLARWADFDWRGPEERIRSWPWVSSALRAVVQRSGGPAVVLLHGWPDSVLRYERVLPLLTGADVVVPALPGFPFSDPLTEPGTTTEVMADLVAATMADLGYERYVVSGGDIGSRVAHQLAARHPEHVAALHLTDIPLGTLFALDPADLSAPERDYLEVVRRWRATEGGYSAEQSTKPHTLAVGLGDSPAGLAAWIGEKLHSWSQHGLGAADGFGYDDALTWITAYWVTGTIGTSFGPYVEPRSLVGPVDTPTAVTQFAHDLVRAPREYGERSFDVRSWEVVEAGGHFGAWERPADFVAGLRKVL
ncbi:alpha/beta fold hydrolase [Kineococcus sp. SYSU DK003]|uniref:alpha/beta fold hydrolase n=1 Tax=Kineococcus sp. SYSU DK003 TaxID=3383124 RepID=UPI003D7EC2B5